MSKLKQVFAPLLVAALFLTSAPAQGKGKGRTGSNDAQIEQQVQQELGKKKQWKDVQAKVDDAIVTLTGTVAMYNDKVQAEKKVTRVAGVYDVVNKITVAGKEVSDDQLYQTLADKLRYDRVDQGIIFGVTGRGQIAGNTFNFFDLDVKNGVVTISGNARTPADAASAVAVVQNTPGVKDVIDNIEVAPASGMDDQLRVRIARAIYGDPVLQKYANDPQAPIRIIVENGRVTLDGMVLTEMDKNVAGMRAREVSGVFGVTNNLAVAREAAK